MRAPARWVGMALQVVPLAATALALTVVGARREAGGAMTAARAPLLIGTGIAYLAFILLRDFELFSSAALLVLAALLGLSAGSWFPPLHRMGSLGAILQTAAVLALAVGCGRWPFVRARFPLRKVQIASWMLLGGWVVVGVGAFGLQAARLWAGVGLVVFFLLTIAWSAGLDPAAPGNVARLAGELYLLALNLALARSVLLVAS